MKILILGSGCAKCAQTENIVLTALSQAQLQAEVQKISNPLDIVRLGVMATPAVIIDGRIVSSGQVPDLQQVIGWLKDS